MPKATYTNAKGLVQELGSGVDIRGEATFRKHKLQNINEATNLTSADCGVITLGTTVTSTQANTTGFNVNLPAPSRGLYYKFIFRPDQCGTNANSAITIKTTSDGSSASDLAVGLVSTNNAPANVTAVAGTITFVHNDKATTGDSAECVCDGTNWFVTILADKSGAVTLA